MDKTPIPLANVRFPWPSRVLRASWCPDKDLLVVVTHVAAADKLSLWKMSGSKKWEVEIERDNASGQEIADISWSPDGQSIAVANNPPLVTIHSLQTGQQERTISIPSIASNGSSKLTGIWWFKEHRVETKETIPDIFKRAGDIAGSAHGLLRTQPLLDALHDDSQPLSATDLFAFKGTQARTLTQRTTPDAFASWPSLPSDPTTASISPTPAGAQERRPGEELDEVDDSNVNSLLVVSDAAGNIYSFLDGSYPLGLIYLGSHCVPLSMHKHESSALFLHAQVSSQNITHTVTRPTIVQVPFLGSRFLRDLARASTSSRELLWHATRVVKEMRATWFGSQTQTGARELGPTWVRALEKRQKEQFGQEEPNAVLDLTVLLTTGRPSDAVSDFFGSGEQMSERGLQKWESNVTEALTKLREYCSKRVAPACQRLHIILQEVHGWSQLPQYSSSGLQCDEVNACLTLAGQAVVCANWLAATARKELAHFREFITWLRFETTRLANPNSDTNPPPQKHDLLEVNEYLVSGLVVSSIDKWFMGRVPEFSPADLGLPIGQDLRTSVQLVRDMLRNREELVWPPRAKHQDLSRLDRNLDLLMQELSTRCHKLFSAAANATAGSVTVKNSLDQFSEFRESGVRDVSNSPIFIRERTVDDTSKGSSFLQYLAIQTPHVHHRSYLCLIRMNHTKDGSALADSISVVTLKCSIAPAEMGQSDIPIEVLDAEFFDDQTLIIVYRPFDRERGATSIATIGYSDLVYEDVPAGYVTSLTREGLMLEILQRLRDGQIAAVPIPMTGSRELVGCHEGRVTLAANGRVGRRVACVLDNAGLGLEVLDMEGEEDEEDEMETAGG